MTALRKYLGAFVAVLAVTLSVGIAAPADAASTSQSGRPIGCC